MAQSITSRLAAFKDHLLTREFRTLKPRVISVGDIHDQGHAAAIAPLPGTLVIYYEKAGGSILKDLAEALAKNDANQLNALGKKVSRGLRPQEKISESKLLDSLPSEPCIFDVRYGSRTIADLLGGGVKQAFGTCTLHYIGGSLNPSEFQVAEYREMTKIQGFEYLIVMRPPYLTRLESEVLKKVPSGLLEISIGNPLAADTFKEVAEFVKREVEHAKQTKSCRFDLLDQFEELVKKGELSPTASAHYLMRTRKELMTRSRKMR